MNIPKKLPPGAFQMDTGAKVPVTKTKPQETQSQRTSLTGPTQDVARPPFKELHTSFHQSSRSLEDHTIEHNLSQMCSGKEPTPENLSQALSTFRGIRDAAPQQNKMFKGSNPTQAEEPKALSIEGNIKDLETALAKKLDSEITDQILYNPNEKLSLGELNTKLEKLKSLQKTNESLVEKKRGFFGKETITGNSEAYSHNAQRLEKAILSAEAKAKKLKEENLTEVEISSPKDVKSTSSLAQKSGAGELEEDPFKDLKQLPPAKPKKPSKEPPPKPSREGLRKVVAEREAAAKATVDPNAPPPKPKKPTKV